MQYVSTLAQLAEMISEGEDSAIMIGGDLVFATNEKEAIDELDSQGDSQYVVQPRRKAGKGRSKAQLYIAIEREAADQVSQYTGPVVLSADQYLAYGLSLRSDAIIVGGGVDEDGTLFLEGYVFTGSALVETFEKSNNFNGMVIDMMLRDFLNKYPDHRVYWCDPLPEPPMCDTADEDRFEVIDTVVVSGTVKRKINTKNQGIEESWSPIPGAAVAIGGLLVFCSVLYYSWSGLEEERKYYASEIAGFEESYANSSQSLELLRHRDYLLRQDASDTNVTGVLDVLLNRISTLENVLIHSIEVFNDSDTSEGQIQTQMGTVARGDFVVEFSVPMVDPSARVQGERIARRLSERSGLSFVILAHRSFIVRSNDIEREYWRYQLSGGVPDAI